VGINHVAVEVGSIDDALTFFERVFGELKLRGRGRHMAFIDPGDQFIALEAGRTQPPDGGRHLGLVVDDQEAPGTRAQAARSSSLFQMAGKIPSPLSRFLIPPRDGVCCLRRRKRKTRSSSR